MIFEFRTDDLEYPNGLYFSANNVDKAIDCFLNKIREQFLKKQIVKEYEFTAWNDSETEFQIKLFNEQDKVITNYSITKQNKFKKIYTTKVDEAVDIIKELYKYENLNLEEFLSNINLPDMSVEQTFEVYKKLREEIN